MIEGQEPKDIRVFTLAHRITCWVYLSKLLFILRDPSLFTSSSESLDEMIIPIQSKRSLMSILLN